MVTILHNKWVALPAATLPPLQITTASLPGATAGTAYSASLSAVGGHPPYTWSLLSAVPNTGSWISVSSAGVLTGTPGTQETEVILVQAIDALGTKASQFFTLAVSGSATIYLQESWTAYPAGNVTSISSALSAAGYTSVTFTNSNDLQILARASIPAGLLADPNFPSAKTQVALFTLPAADPDETRLTWANTTVDIRDVSCSWWEYRPNGNNGGEKFHRSGNWVNGVPGTTRGIDYIIGYGNPAGTVTLFSQGNFHTWPDVPWGTFSWPSGLHHFERVEHYPSDTSATYSSSFYIDGVLQGSASGLQAYDNSTEALQGWQLWDMGGWASGAGTFPIQRYICAARIASTRQGVWAIPAV